MATENQKRAFKKTLKSIEEGERVDMGEIMLESGYSKATTINPGKNLLNTNGWQELMDRYLPDDLLVKKNLELLNHKEWQAVNAGLDKAYKVKGKLIENLNAIQINIGRKSTEKLQDEELNRLMDVFGDKEIDIKE